MENRDASKGAGKKEENAPESKAYPADKPGMTYHETQKANDPDGEAYPDKPDNHPSPEERLWRPDNGAQDQND